MSPINPPEKTSPITPIDPRRPRDSSAKRGATTKEPKSRPYEQDVSDRNDDEPPHLDEFA